ncbi:FAD-dependent oxidoreductase [Marinobacter halodurans]|uniref:FAD-dependent oxidoreductase n=1 Tax=Marinobacter halodurans TaxID=2528979 RepID=A0ABY1ZPB1_9GAMM|nr:FAD-dependent oxidoreductase [Marinobacter halodurans]TBW56039.1 FAD-dependent oxidoreductase [Marinobacter halodurans]
MDHTQPVESVIRSVAIVGSGMSGLTAAIQLREAGLSVTLFEKGRGPGGRLAARRVPDGTIDIGAQYFTIRDPAFRRFLENWAGNDSFGEWHGQLRFQQDDGRWTDFMAGPRYVGVPRMSVISRALATDLAIHYNTRIARVLPAGSGWALEDTEGVEQGMFDAVVISTPPAQIRDLLAASDTGLDDSAHELVALPLDACWAVMAAFPENPCPGVDGFSCRHPALQWAANNSSKPGRENDGCWWVLHARADWSEEHRGADPDWVAHQLLDAFGACAHLSTLPETVLTHRWLYAKTRDGGDRPGHIWHARERIGFCGDWLAGGRVEGAFQSGLALAGSMLRSREAGPDDDRNG